MQSRQYHTGWSPSEELRKALDRADKLRDKVELVIVAYSLDHGGNGPSMAEIATALHVAKSNVERCIIELIALGRAERLDGKLVIAQAVYSHPLIRRVR